ncbi:MAG: hydroxymethylglutaryl-CoA lyase [Bacteroidota bacterium]
MQSVKLIECPRDAMQGIVQPIPTATKIDYLNQLLRVGFDTLDFGSFVSPKAVPQLADTAEVLAGLDLTHTATQLLAIVANARGAHTAAQHAAIHYLGYPFSISETFQLRNTRKTMAESVELVRDMQALCVDSGKELVVYISMGFGNPYGDPWSPKLAGEWVEKMVGLGVRTISLADTVGTADHATIGPMFSTLIPRFPEVEFGAHFHARPDERRAKLQAAWEGGCRRFDSAMLGFGGCPFAEDELVGNIATEAVLEWLHGMAVDPELAEDALDRATQKAQRLFGEYH